MKRLDLIGSISGLRQRCRKGIFFVLAIVSLMAAMTFVVMSVDLGMITVTQTRMQSSADAAALAAAQEIVVGIREAGEQGETNVQAVQAIAAAAAAPTLADAARGKAQRVPDSPSSAKPAAVIQTVRGFADTVFVPC